jgi:hypothetical protein
VWHPGRGWGIAMGGEGASPSPMWVGRGAAVVMGERGMVFGGRAYGLGVAFEKEVGEMPRARFWG